MDSLYQKRFGRGSQTLDISDKSNIKITYSSLTNKSEEIYNLFDIDENHERYLVRPIKWLVLAAIFFAISYPFVSDYFEYKDVGFLGLMLVFVVPGIICIQQYFQKHSDLIVFRYRSNGEVAFYLWNNNPSEEKLKEFLSGLSTLIKSIKINPKATDEQKLSLYKEYLQILLSEDVITEDEAIQIYERTSKKIENKDKAAVLSIAR